MARSKGEPMETPEYAQMLKRMIRAYGRRVGDADYVDLAEMLEVQRELDAAIAAAVLEQADRTSWATVAEGLGVTREAAWKRYARKVTRATA